MFNLEEITITELQDTMQKEQVIKTFKYFMAVMYFVISYMFA